MQMHASLFCFELYTLIYHIYIYILRFGYGLVCHYKEMYPKFDFGS